MKNKLFIAAKAFILNKGKVLIIREAPNHNTSTQAGKYGMPGGRLKPGERYAVGLQREVKEETGLNIKIGSPIMVDEWRPKIKKEFWQIIGIFFSCSAANRLVHLSHEHDDFKWIKPKDFKKFRIIKNETEVFKTFLSKNRA